MPDLPAHSGPDAQCPMCGIPVVLTEYHRAARLGPGEMAGHRPPCASLIHLARPAGRGRHLCRVCLNCGHGWAEACPAPAETIARRRALPSPAACAGLLALVCGLEAAAASGAVSMLLAGSARVVGWCAVALAVAAWAWAGYTALARAGAGHLAKDAPEQGAAHGGAHCADRDRPGNRDAP